MAAAGRWGLVVRWLVPTAGVALLVGVVALAGGFREARADAGPAADPGEIVALARWDLAVDAVELVDTTVYDSPTTTNLRVHLTVVLTDGESVSSLPSGLVEVVVPDGGATGVAYQVDPVLGSGLDPDLPRTYVLDVPWPAPDDEGEQSPVAAAPATVSVVVRDEVYAEGAIFGWSWGVTDVAAVVTVPVTDERVGA